MRPEKLYLVDILEAADAIQRFIESTNEEEFLRNELRQSGVLQKLIVIGEAAARLPRFWRNTQKLNGRTSSDSAILLFMNTLLSCGRLFGKRR
jgi:hypothetical protein